MMGVFMALRRTLCYIPGLRSAAFHSFPHRLSHSSSTRLALVDFQRRKEAFMNVLPSIVDPLINNFSYKEVDGVTNWINEIINYNVIGGKLIRGLIIVLTYEAFEKPENVTEQTLRLSYILGWCVEMLQSYSIMLDDIMDGSMTRRGLPCWYRLPHVGIGAINDAVFLFSSMNYTLKTNFGQLPQYSNIVDVLNQTLLQTGVGQHLDYSMVHGEKDYSKFTTKFYDTIAILKTGYIFKLSFDLGMILANVNDKHIQHKADKICLKIGRLFQVQDDYIDVFASESVTGKLGTDIQEGKCSWLAVTALHRCNDTQRREFERCYGSSDPADVERIRKLYQDLSIPELYKREEQMCAEEVKMLANEFDGYVANVLLNMLNLIYKRSK